MVKQKESSKKAKKAYALPKWFWSTLVAIVVLVVSSVAYFFYWRTGWPGYLQALNKCDGRPPVIVNTFINDGYVAPDNRNYRIPGGADAISPKIYFCTEAEAKAAGYTPLES